MQSEVLAASSSWRREALESACLALLIAGLLFSTGRARYEAVTTLSLDDVSAMRDSGQAAPQLSPPEAAKRLLAQAVRYANDPPLSERALPREFRVDVLRNHQLQLFCEAEGRELAAQLCNRTVDETVAKSRELRAITRAQTSTRVRRRAFDAAWPALLAGLGWLLIRTARRGARADRQAADASNPQEWHRWSVPNRPTASGARAMQMQIPVSMPARMQKPLQVPVHARRGSSLRPPRTVETIVGMPAVVPPADTARESSEATYAYADANFPYAVSGSSAPPYASPTSSAPPPTAARVSTASESNKPALSARSSMRPPSGAPGSKPAEARTASSAPDPSTRVIYHVSNGPWKADPQVLTEEPLEVLYELRDELFRDPNARCLTIRIASGANSRYAKSQVAAQLAWILAERQDKRVLLVEADLDAPALHKLMRVNLPRGFGFSEQLERLAEGATRNEPSPVTLLRVGPTLHALVEGRWGTPALFDSPQFSAVLAQQRADHDVIVMDGPVVDDWPDAQALHGIAEGVVFVVAAGTPLPEAMKLSAKHFQAQPMLRIVKTGEWPDI